MTFEGTAELTPIDHALAAWVTTFDHLVKLAGDGGLDGFDAGRVVGFMQEFERPRNRLALIDHQIIAAAERLDLPTVLCQGSMRRVLTSVLSLSKGEAARRVRAAEAVGPRTSMLGETLEPVRPVLAAAQQAGEVSAEKVAIIDSALDRVDRRGFAPADIATGEQLLTEQAAVFPPEDLRLLADKVVDGIDPDGTLSNDELNTDRRYFHLQATRDGAYVGDFRLTGTARRETENPARPTRQTPDRPSGAVDGRTHGQRTHDALEDVCDRQLRAGDVPDAGGIPATVIVTIDADDLMKRVGYGRDRRRHPAPDREAAAVGQQCRHHPRRPHRHRRCARSRPNPADRQPLADPGVDRPRRRLFVSRVRASAAILRTTPRPGGGFGGGGPREGREK